MRGGRAHLKTTGVDPLNPSSVPPTPCTAGGGRQGRMGEEHVNQERVDQSTGLRAIVSHHSQLLEVT